MPSVLDAFAKAVAQLPDPSFRRVLWRGIGIALGIWLALAWAIWLGFESVPPTHGWLGSIAAAAGALAAFALITVLFPAFASLGIALFLDDIAEAVERRHYPLLPPGRAPSAAAALGAGLRFLVLSLVVNLLALPLYLASLLLTPLNLFVFYLVNGYLLGREYFELVAMRHHDAADRRRLRRAMRGQRIAAGLGIAVLFSIPVANLAAPLLATAVMVHLIVGAGGLRSKELEHVQSRQEGRAGG